MEIPAVIRFSVPKNHSVCLPCGSSDSADVIWTLQDKEVLVTRRGSYMTNKDRQHYLLKPNGLCILHLDESHNGGYRCNQQLVAELQVLTGHEYVVSAGRTLLLPCRGSFKSKQRWFQQREDERREAILTKFKNGTVKPEKDGGRLSFSNNALQIQDLQLEDAGEYLCNGVLQARVTILPVHPETTARTTPSSAVMTTVAETKKINMKPEIVLLLIAVVSLGLMIIFLAAVCVLLTSMKCRRKKKYRAAATPRREDTELQPWKPSSRQKECEECETPSLQGEMIHYASLGRQNWRERPSRSPPDQSHHSVIYSSVITRPAAR
ncbi:uncharacterized protein LOC115788157 [Archocentrus centrarchus]|uniref:uncharacterized protein LOC115788157 n=1 Tax=Archocentrus centrarchus TaxID=63155 RepID=UPI0011EA373D|nr:uncharacterized protein LOC115788157 [Archocentrus centrarchus]